MRTAVPERSIRFDWVDGTQVNVTFVVKDAAKSSVSVQHVKLSGKDDIAVRKSFWQEKLDRLRGHLEGTVSNP
ncbi:MAG: hypothetical protein R3E97_02105 [Candidatus Eisenbacteria bacterium]